MALALAVKATANSANDDDAPSVTTGAFTPADTSLLVVVALSQNGNGDGVLTPSGGGLTYTSRALTTGAGDFELIGQIWTAPVVTGASMTVTITGDSAAFGAVGVAVVQITGHDATTPIGAILAAVTGSRSGAYSPSLSGTSAATSIVIAGGIVDFGTATKGSAWTEIYDYRAAAGDTQHDGNIEYIAGAVSAANWAALNSSFSTAAVAVEIKVAAEEEEATLDGDLQAQDAAIDATASAIVAATAAIQAQSSQIDGVVNVAAIVSGALEAQAATVAGAVSAIIAIDGDLQSQASSVEGSVLQITRADGSLQAQSSQIAGAISVIVAIDGDLEAQISSIDGLVEVLLAIDGDLEAQDAQIDGTLLTGTPVSGALAAQSATIEGLATVGIALIAALQAQSAQTTGALAVALASDGSITSQNASIVGSISTELLRPPKNTFVKRAGWGRSARFWVERDR